MAFDDDAERRLNAARKAFLEIDDAYESAADDRASLKAHADRFIDDPDPNRSTVIRDHARRVKNALDRFGQDERFLVSDVSLALMAMRVRIQGTMVEALQRHLDGVFLDLDALAARVEKRTGRAVDRDVLEPVRFFELARMSELNLTTRGIEGAALMVELHIATVRLFLEKHVERDLNVVVQAIREMFAEDARETLIVAIWETLKEVAPEVAAEIAPMARAAGLMVRLREKVLRLHVPFRKAGPEDAILDAALLFEEQVAACNAAREMLRSMAGPQDAA